MSALYVRELARSWANSIPDIPFYDTINREPSPAQSIWFTMYFTALDKTGTFEQIGYLETGIIDLIFASNPGQGDAELLTALEAVVPQFMGYVDPTARLSLNSYEPVAEVTSGGGDRYYRLGVGVNYTYSLE